ncbi:MAG: 50S ribosomal protein L6 [Clostridiales bacterium]|nr:50S ribosomal protein L6 [Clostridiales bacterium]
MSRIGKNPVAVPAGVQVTLGENNTVTVKGPKGTLTQSFHPAIKIELNGDRINVTRPNDEKENRALHGLTRTLINNMVVGVTEGYKKELHIEGVGYRAQKQGKQLVLNLGYSHQVIFEENSDISIEVPAPNRIVVSGPDKQKVGQMAAEIRMKRPPEPYKGKGIRYVGEVVRRKEGKTGAKK